MDVFSNMILWLPRRVVCTQNYKDQGYSFLESHAQRKTYRSFNNQPYSVTSSLNSFLGDDFLKSFIMVYKDEKSILEQTYQKQICLDFCYDDSLFA